MVISANIYRHNLLQVQHTERFLRKTKQMHPLTPMLSWDYWNAFGNWFTQNRKLGRIPDRRWPESKLLDNFMSEHFRMLEVWAIYAALGKIDDIPDEDLHGNVMVGATIVHDLLSQETKYLKIAQEKVVEFMEIDGPVPQRFLQNIKTPFDQFFIEFDKPWIYPNWITAGGDNKEPHPVHIWGVQTQTISSELARQLITEDKSDKGPWVRLIIIYAHNLTDGPEGEIRLINNLDYMPRSLWNDEDEDYWESTIESEDVEHSDNLFRPVFPTVTDSDFLVLSLFDGSIYVGPSNYASNVPQRSRNKTFMESLFDTKVGTIYDLGNLRLDRTLMARYPNYQAGVRSWGEFARTFSTTLLYMMSKSIKHIKSRPLNRAEQRRGQKHPSSRPRGSLPVPWIQVEVAPMDEKISPATGTGTPHGHQYDVRGHIRHTKRRLKDGTIQHNVGWVKSHVRGPEESEYIPKVHSYSGDMELTLPVKKFIIEGPTEQE